MPRRPPPTGLRLVNGPLPPRSQPRHTLPSQPMPAFHPQGTGPVPRARDNARVVPALAVDTSVPLGRMYASPLSSGPYSHSRNSSSVSLSSISSSPRSSISSRVRGPWDHSGSISFQVEIDSMLAAPKPAAII